MRCNCENASGDCDHGKGNAFRACEREAGEGEIEYLGNVCDTCWRNYPERYRRRAPDGSACCTCSGAETGCEHAEWCAHAVTLPSAKSPARRRQST